MSSVSSVSSTKSIYGNRNVITGLASGMDTESMIENAISGYKSKISSLQQKRTKTEWKQEAYRSMIAKMASFSSKYASYMSSNNLMSASFFNSAVKTVTKGKYADKISATGRASSNVQINSVKQLATAATYTLSGTALDRGTSAFKSDTVTATASGSLDLGGTTTVNGFSGNMTLAYGGSSALSYLSINFDESKTYDSMQDLADEINKQLKEQSVSIGTTTYTGDELLNDVVRAEVSKDGKSITFADPKGNNVYISSASDSVRKELLGGQTLSSTYGKQVKSLSSSDAALKKMGEDGKMSTFEYLMRKGASMELTVDGKTKSISMPDYAQFTKKLDELAEGTGISEQDLSNYKKILMGDDSLEVSNEETRNKLDALRDQAYMGVIQDNVKQAFGDKVKVSNVNEGTSGIKLQFETTQKGSSIVASTNKGEVLGFGSGGKVTSYLNTSKTLGELMSKYVGDDGNFDAGKIGNDFDLAYEKDANGNPTNKLATDADGNQLYSFKVNGKEVGQFNAKSKLSDVFSAMNSSSDSEVKVSYSQLTNTLTFTAKETGADSKVDFSGMADKLFNNHVDKLQGNFNDAYGLQLDDETVKLTVHLPGFDAKFDVNDKMSTQDVADAINKAYQNSQYTASVNEMTGELELLNKNGGGKVDFTMEYGGTGWKFDVEMPKIDTGYTRGQDAIMDVTVNGTKIENFTRSSNNVDIDGLTVTLKGTFETAENEDPVTFETSADADKIVDVVKQMVEDYNAMVTEIKNAYSTLPLQRSNGAYYEPLTDEDMEGMSESSIKKWEDNAKTGLLFGDRDLSDLYSRLTNAVSMTGEFGATLRAAGITVSYSNGLSTLEFNETDFRAALEKDPDAVRDAFISSTDNGAKSNGLMASLKAPLDMYGKTTGGKGILVDKAGSPLAASTLYTNSLQKELDEIDNQISKWQDKMSDKVDYYTNQFSKLEQLIQQMNSQSSYFSQLMGG